MEGKCRGSAEKRGAELPRGSRLKNIRAGDPRLAHRCWTTAIDGSRRATCWVGVLAPGRGAIRRQVGREARRRRGARGGKEKESASAANALVLSRAAGRHAGVFDDIIDVSPRSAGPRPVRGRLRGFVRKAQHPRLREPATPDVCSAAVIEKNSAGAATTYTMSATTGSGPDLKLSALAESDSHGSKR